MTITDGSTLILNDGTGRGAVTAEFDADGLATATMVEPAEEMQVGVR